MKKLGLLLLSINFFSLHAQEWTNGLDSNATYYDVKAAYDNFWKDKTPQRGQGYKTVQRWWWATQPRTDASGDMKMNGAKRSYLEYQKWLNETKQPGKNQSNAAITATTANWSALGPFGSATNTGAGRLQCIRFHPAGTGTVYVGAAAGGLWKSTNGGTSWTTTTDQIASLGVSDIAINPSNNNIMYIATGDFDSAPTGFSGGDSKSIGVLKSTDGGATWNATGLSWTTSQSVFISRLLINPLNPIELFAFTSGGIYRTTNSAANWTLVAAGYFKDGEYKPTDTTTIYAANTNNVIRSTDGGATWNSTGYNATGISQIRMAVTAANPNVVYVVGTSGTNAFGNLQRSTNSGVAFSVMSTTPNVLGGTQAWYDLSIAASPTSSNEVCVGGIDLWLSTNGGTTWAQKTFGYGGGPYCHPDQHDAIYQNGTTIWIANDGGVDRSTNNGSTWSNVNGNMNVGEPYFIGVSATSATRIVAGLQDNGSIVWNGTTWFLGKGGDGMEPFVDWSNPNILVASSQNGGHARSTNGGSTYNNIVSGLTGNANWIAPICQDPNTANTYYAGRQHVFKSTNAGASWAQLGTLPGSGDVMLINPAPSNPNVIYAARTTAIYKTTDGGASWSAITGTLPVTSRITDIDVDNTNANNVYVTLAGYVANTKVFFSNNGGVSWTNISAGLPNLPANSIVYRKNSPGVIYVGMDFGVYYKETSMPAFIPYNTGLPNVWVNDMEIFYPTGKLRAATFGRGIWETNLYSNPTAPPSAYFTNQFTSGCVNVPYQFNDASANTPTSWSWSFPGGSPATSTSSNPIVTYATAGIYTVTLTSTNGNGPSSPYTTTITVNSNPTISAVCPSVCANTNTNIPVTTNGAFVTWSTGYVGNVLNLPSATTNSLYTFTVSLGACTVASSCSLTVWPVPAIPTIGVNGMSLTTGSATSYQWYLNGTPIAGETNQDMMPTQDGWYTVEITNSFGCTNGATAMYITVTDLKSASHVLTGVNVSPNPAKDQLLIKKANGVNTSLNYEIVNLFGQRISSGTLEFKTPPEAPLNIQTLASGTYFIRFNDNSNTVSLKFIKE
jgi:PKD repeat protein